MITVTTDNIPGRDVREVLGIVQGSTVQTKHIGRDIAAGFKTIIGGELRGYTDLMKDAREKAILRMEEHARSKGADAILNVRLVTATVTMGAAEILAYGTAVALNET